MSAFDAGQRRADGSAQMANDTRAGVNRATRGALPNFARVGWIPRRSSIVLLIAATLFFASSVGAFAASDREDCAADAASPDQKIASCSHVIADDGEDAATRAHAYGSRGAAYYGNGDYDRAIADFTEAMKLDPSTVPAYFAPAYGRRGLAYAEKRDYDHAIADYGEAIRLDPNSAPAYNGRGLAYFREGDLDRAIADYNEAVKRNPGYAIAYDNRGLAYANKNDYDRALADYDEAIKRNPRLANAYAHRGVLYRAEGDYDRSITDLKEAIARDPNSGYAYRNRCSAYYAKKSYDAAISDCGEAIRLNPKDDLAYSTRGLAYAAKRDYDAAIADGSEAIRLNPKSGFGYNSRGAAYNAKKQYEAAISDYSEAIRLNPKMFAAYGNRGITYRNQGNFDLAITDFDQAIQINPKYFQGYNLRGMIYAARGDHSRAVADYSEAIKLDPIYVEAYDNRGLAYKALGLADDANSDFRKAQSIDPSDRLSSAQLALSSPDPFPTTAAAAGADTAADPKALSAAMSRLSLDLPMDIAGIGPVRKSLEDLNREPCDQQAILALGLALDRVGRKREAAGAQVRFSQACGGHAPSLKVAVNMLLALSDYAGAAAAAAELIKLDPHDDGSFYLRAVAYDRGGSAKQAIDDYLTAIELSGNKANISSDSYLAVARNYEKLGQFCDAESIIESWVALNPQRNDSSRMQAIIADYTAKGKCDALNGRGEEVFRTAPNHGVLKLPVVVNGVRGTFILDTGATWVTMSTSFAEKAKVQIDQGVKLKMHTANGVSDAKRGRAATIQLRSLQAKDVVVVVQPDAQGSYGDGVDGLLGMSFLSRFKVSIDTQTVKIASRNAK